MKLFHIIALASTAISLSRAGERIPAPEVVVCLDGWGMAGPGVLRLAERQAISMFAAVDVRIAWRYASLAGCPALPESLIIPVRLQAPTPQDYRVGVLAVAFPYAGGGSPITILYDRMVSMATRYPARQATILAHVLVHEITHVLQSSDRHSEAGVMKARWNGDDYMTMLWERLAFAPDDAALIHKGLARLLARAGLSSTKPPVL